MSRESYNWHKRRENACKRRERLEAARQKATHTKGEWRLLLAMFPFCVRCGDDEYHLEKDHIIPLYQGGSDGINNIQPSCARCNASKGSEDIDYRAERISNWRELFCEFRRMACWQ